MPTTRDAPPAFAPSHDSHDARRRRDSRLGSIAAKIDRGERLSLDEGELLFSTPDLWSVIALADRVRRRLHGEAAYYNINRHLNYSNVCALSCKFCEFYRKTGDDGAYTRDLAYIREEVRKAVEAGATEMHSVGGLHPTLPFSYYTDLVSTIRDESKRLGSELHVKAFTAVEIVHLARIAKQYKGASEPGEAGRLARRDGIRWVLTHLKAAGLGSLPGGGAEVFDDRVHDEAYKSKIRSDVWLDVHRVAHELGLNTNATLLYGHIESHRDRLVHMDMLRRAQDEALARMGYGGEQWRSGEVAQWRSEDVDADGVCSGHLGYRADESHAPAITLTRPNTPLPEHLAFGQHPPTHSATSSPPPGYYQTIIPLPFIPDGSDLEHLPGPSGLENLRTIAIARLMLDNIPHVKAFWIMQTLAMAQLMLQAGADDLDGTVVWYDITKVGHAPPSPGGPDLRAGPSRPTTPPTPSPHPTQDQQAAAASQTNTATHQQVTVWTLEKAIREAGFTPIERDTLYRRVHRKGRAWRVEGSNT